MNLERKRDLTEEANESLGAQDKIRGAGGTQQNPPAVFIPEN